MTKKDKYSLYCVVMTERWLAGGELCRRGWEGGLLVAGGGGAAWFTITY